MFAWIRKRVAEAFVQGVDDALEMLKERHSQEIAPSEPEAKVLPPAKDEDKPKGRSR